MNTLSRQHPTIALRFAIAIACAERIYGKRRSCRDWAAKAVSAEHLPIVAFLYCHDDPDGETPTLILAQEEDGRLYIAKSRSAGRTENEQLTELFEETAAELFPELAPEGCPEGCAYCELGCAVPVAV